MLMFNNSKQVATPTESGSFSCSFFTWLAPAPPLPVAVAVDVDISMSLSLSLVAFSLWYR
jgi:hypothetical protein